MTFVSFWFLGIIYCPVPPAGEYPRSRASNSDMNSPSLVLPKKRDPGFQYLPGRVFTQTSLAVEVSGAVFVSRTLGAGGLLPTYFLYASIQSEAVSRWAVFRSNWPAHTSLWSFGAIDYSVGCYSSRIRRRSAAFIFNRPTVARPIAVLRSPHRG